jgi:hypothetical protein
MCLPPASAIPESDIYKFKSAVRGYMTFDEFMGNSTDDRALVLKSFDNGSISFYVVLRANVGDAPPYDDFYVRMRCSGDALPLEFHTTDYASWNKVGQISFKRTYDVGYVEQYDNLSMPAILSSCQIESASGLAVDGNLGYTDFYMEMVPILSTNVITLDEYCTGERRVNVTGNIKNSILLVLTNNVNFIYTLWILFQIMAVIIVVIGVPVMVLLLIRWALWRLAGFKLFERSGDS